MKLEQILEKLKNGVNNEDIYLTKSEAETLRIYIYQLEQLIQRIKEII